MDFALLYLLPVIPMIVMIITDFSTRKVSVLWLGLFILCICVLSFATNGLMVCLWNMLINLVLLIYLSAGICIYLKLKTRRWVNPLNKYIGSGDLWLFIGLTPLFGLEGYLLFTLTSLLLSLVLWSAVFIFSKKQFSIPLVGVVGIIFCIWTINNTINL